HKPLYDGLPRYHIANIRGAVTEKFLESWAATPDFCTAVFNVRATPNKSIESTKSDMETVLVGTQRREPGMRDRIIILRRMLGFEAPPESQTLAGVTRAYRDVMGTAPQVGGVQPFMFMASDSGFMSAAGMKDGVLLGPGRFTSSLPDEHVEVEK